LFENFSKKSLKGDLMNDTTDNPLTGVEVFRVGLIVGVVLFWVSMTKVSRVHRK
jgi:hypothetical protein